MSQEPPTDRASDYDYIGPNQYANPVGKDSEGNIIWEAGPKSKKFDAGEKVSDTYAKQVRGSIGWRNRVKGLVANPKEETPDTYQKAQQILSEFNDLSDQLEKAETDQEIQEIEQKIDQKRANLGS